MKFYNCHTILRVVMRQKIKYFIKLGLVADPVIKAIVRLEFEDGLRTVVLLGGCWGLRVAAPSLGSIPNPPGGGLVLGAVWLS